VTHHNHKQERNEKMTEEPKTLEPLPRGADADSLESRYRTLASELRGVSGITNLFALQTDVDRHQLCREFWDDLQRLEVIVKRLRETGFRLKNQQELDWQRKRRQQVALDQAMYGNF
jgi:hypothetical protein